MWRAQRAGQRVLTAQRFAPRVARRALHACAARASRVTPNSAPTAFGKPRTTAPAVPTAAESASLPIGDARAPPAAPPTGNRPGSRTSTGGSSSRGDTVYVNDQFGFDTDPATTHTPDALDRMTSEVLEVEPPAADDDLNPDGTRKTPAADAADGADDATAAAAGATLSPSASATMAAAASGRFDMSPENIRATYQRRVEFLRSHGYHHKRLSPWIGDWTTDQRLILSARKSQIDIISDMLGHTPRAQAAVKLFFSFRHLNVWARLRWGSLHRQHDKQLVRRSLWCVHRQSMSRQLFDPHFFGIPNDYQGRLIVRALHLWVVQHKLKVSPRLREGPNPGESADAYAAREDVHRKAYIKLLFDRWWSGVRSSQSAHGTPAMLQDKTAKQSQKKVFALMLMLDKCMQMREDGDPAADSALQGVLWRNVYGGTCDNKQQLRALSAYLIAQLTHYATRVSADDVYCGNLTWAPFPRTPISELEHEKVVPEEFATPMLEKGQYVELDPSYKL